MKCESTFALDRRALIESAGAAQGPLLFVPGSQLTRVLETHVVGTFFDDNDHKSSDTVPHGVGKQDHGTG